MTETELLLARAAIADCIHTYALAIRRGDPAGAAALFAADGCFETRDADPRDLAASTRRWRAEGRPSVLAQVTASTAQVRMLPMIHNLLVTVEPEGDRATASSLMVGRAWPSDREMIGEYADSLVREDGRWCFAERIYTIYAVSAPSTIA